MKKFNAKLWIPTFILCTCVIIESILSALHLTTEIHYTWYELLLSIGTIIPSYYIAYLIGKTRANKTNENESKQN